MKRSAQEALAVACLLFGLTRRQHQPLEQLIERRARLVTEPGVDRRGLDDRAARRDQPVKPLAAGQRRDRPAARIAGRDQRDQRERRGDLASVGRWR